MANLFEIDNKINELLESDAQRSDELTDLETGEIASLEELLNQLEIEQKTKIENIGCYIKNIAADVDALKLEEKKLAERRKVKENQIERLKNYLSMNLQEAGYNKFETSRVVLSFRTSKAIEIAEGTELDDEFLTVKVTKEANKKALKEAIETGFEIEGVKLVEKKNIQIK